MLLKDFKILLPNKYKHLDIADPYIFQDKNVFFMYVTCTQRDVGVFTSNNLKNWDDTKFHIVYTSKRCCWWLAPAFGSWNGVGVWAPVVHKKKSKYVMYFTEALSIYVSESDNPLGPFSISKRVALPNHLVLDPKPVTFGGVDWLMYTSIDLLSKDSFKIWIVALSSYSIIDERTHKCIITPTLSWEKHTACVFSGIVEAPMPFIFNNKICLFYSGSGADTNFYNMGIAISKSINEKYTKVTDPIVDNSKYPGTGHCSLIKFNEKLYLFCHTKYTKNRRWNRTPCMFEIDKNYLDKIMRYL